MDNKQRIYKLTVCSLMAALMCVLGPMSIPIGPVPVSLTSFVIYLTVFLLGSKLSVVSCLVYLALGVVGFPVFSGFQGGLQKLAGPTGGYLIGFILMAFISGIVLEKANRKAVLTVLGMFAATLIDYLFGTAWFVFQMKCGVWYALTVCVFPFIVFDIIKIVIATLIGQTLRTALQKSGLI